MRSGGTRNNETVHVTKSGRRFPVECTVTFVTFDDSEYICAICEDITERKEAEEALKESEERFRDFAESASDWFWEMDADLTFTFGSDRYYEITGRQREDEYGQGREILAHPELEDLASKKWQDHFATLERREAFTGFEYVTKIKAGAALHISLSGVPVFAADGAFLGYRGTARDVTERKQVEAELIMAKERAEYADRSKSEFLANMSHELRTPLNAIMGFAELMSQQVFGPMGDQRYQSYISSVFESGEHLLSMINGILELSKIEAGSAVLQESNLDLEEIVQSCTAIMKVRATDAGLIIEVAGVAVLPALRADERMLKQMLLNLLSNAVKFTDRGGKITVVGELQDDGALRISVTDTGIGIAARDIPKAMSTFGQVDSALDRRFEGTGLGLPLVQSLAEMHNGGFDIESELGVGTKATIWFPGERVVRNP